jgi:hypothetical protein
MTYLGTPWIDSRVPYAPVRNILATCQPLRTRFQRWPPSGSLTGPKRTSGAPGVPHESYLRDIKAARERAYFGT